MTDDIIAEAIAEAVALRPTSPSTTPREYVVRGPHAEAVASRVLSARTSTSSHTHLGTPYPEQAQAYHQSHSGSSSSNPPTSFEESRPQSPKAADVYNHSSGQTPRVTTESARTLGGDYAQHEAKENGGQDSNSIQSRKNSNSNDGQKDRDEEKGNDQDGDENDKDPNIVDWDGPEDPENPMSVIVREK